VVRADRQRLAQVLANLIANGIKYNDGPERLVEVGVDGDSPPGGEGAVRDPMVIYVRDNGIGIPAQHTESVFRMFRRLHARDRYGGGSGAGLAIARKIVERHGGRLWHGPAPDRGTIFRFTLAPAPGVRPVPTVEQEIRQRPVPGRDEVVPSVEEASRAATNGESARGARRERER
jgi:signal transduction histidine kinase